MPKKALFYVKCSLIWFYVFSGPVFWRKEEVPARCARQLSCVWLLRPTGQCVILCVVQLITTQNALILHQLVRTEEDNKQGLQGNMAEILKVESQKVSPLPVRTSLT